MQTDFFESKRPWSKYKDQILGYYLEPYIPKVARIGRPVLIVDGFAGCGKFRDGKPGSPLIIASALHRWRKKGIDISGEFVESVHENFLSLQHVLGNYTEFTTVLHGQFEDHIEKWAKRARSETVFLYVDPYSVKGLVFERLKSVYERIHDSDASVEILMNFNVTTFMRWSLAALKRTDEFPSDAISEESDFQADDPDEHVEIATLNGIAGGDYWQAIAIDGSFSFAQKLEAFADEYVSRMRRSFRYVCSYPVKSKYEHQTPKYMLIYATRHPDGLCLMNDAMCKARNDFLGSQFRSDTLFDMTPNDELPNLSEVKESLLCIVGDAIEISRKDARSQLVQAHFCRYEQKELNRAVTELLKSKRLVSSTGKTRINDSVLLRLGS